jgi:CRISPR-associated protein Cas2
VIVIALSKVPLSLRGDLTKWCQEIQVGIYVGRFSARIRDQLWERIQKNIGSGEATIVYTTNNELGYTFKSTRRDRKVVNYEGIPLLMHVENQPTSIKHGFSDAAKFQRIRYRQSRGGSGTTIKKRSIVALDIETTGLDVTTDKILSIGAVKQNSDKEIERLYRIIKIDSTIPAKIVKLTGLSQQLVEEKGVDLATALTELKEFIGKSMVVGYNIVFDWGFIENGYAIIGQERLDSRLVDLMQVVRKKEAFLDNFRFETVLKNYKIENHSPHNSMSDAEATVKLMTKLIEKGFLKI